MSSHPYISGVGNITQMIGFLRKNFPATVTSDTVKKFQLASNNESYVINALQFIGLIDEKGNRTNRGHEVLTKVDEDEFKSAFEGLIRDAYKDLFDLRGDDVWTMSKDQLIGYFRSTDKTSDVIGTRQAAVFQAFRKLAGREQAVGTQATARTAKLKAATKPRTPKTKTQTEAQLPNRPTLDNPQRDMSLTVRIEINLPAEGSQETYDSIFKSIKANLLP
jgi:hypothetical protein